MREVRIAYERRDRCPLCGAAGESAGHLTFGYYAFAGVRIPYPVDGPPLLLSCPRCGLVYKRDIPAREELAALFQQMAGRVWAGHGYKFPGVRALVARAAAPRGKTDLLDIGSADGKMLETFSNLGGRLSALDVFHDPTCARRVTGEYIQGFVDGDLDWSERPYDVALALDLFEHLYDPARALANLGRLVRPGGALAIQTGNASYPASIGRRMGQWWYANLFDHHVFWAPQTFSYVAAQGGWTVEWVEESVHKDGPEMPWTKRTAVRTLRAFSRFPPLRGALNAALRRDVRLLAEPRARDHLDCILRRV